MQFRAVSGLGQWFFWTVK